MRILITTQIVDIHDPGLGFFHRWVEVFAQECESVQVICLKEGEHHFPANVTVRSLGKERGVSRLCRLVTFWTIIWRTRHTYDAVFVHMNPEYIVVGGLLWRLLGKRISLWYAHRSVNLKLKIAHFFAHQIFTGSSESFRIPSQKVLVTGQGVDTAFFTPRESVETNAGPRLLVVGRIAPIKNIELAITTVRKVCDILPGATLRVVGAPGKAEDEVYQDRMRKMVEEWGASDFIAFVGGKDSVGVLGELQNADVFLHTSNTNSADKTAVEAMATGVYQVTSSPVYRKDLPSTCFQEPDEESYATEVIRYMALPQDEKLRLASLMREAAIREHSLERLVRIIVEKLRK